MLDEKQAKIDHLYRLPFFLFSPAQRSSLSSFTAINTAFGPVCTCVQEMSTGGEKKRGGEENKKDRDKRNYEANREQQS
jgi:hypothetical protein